MPEKGLFHFRAHYGNYNPVDICNFVKEKAEVVIMVKELDANRPHIHSVITEFKQTKSTFRQQLLRQFPLLADRNHSIQKKDDMSVQVRYCCKGENDKTMPDVLFSTIDVKEFHEAYWEVNRELVRKTEEGNMGSQKDTSLVSKTKSKTWTEKVFDEIINIYEPECRHIKYKYEIGKSSMTEYEIIQEVKSRLTIFQYFIKRLGYRRMNRRIVNDMFDGIVNGIIQTSEKAGENYSHELFKEIYPDDWKLMPKGEMTKPAVKPIDTKEDNIILCIIEDD